jgi:selenocysteine lyase/cysteine desulfurase
MALYHRLQSNNIITAPRADRLRIAPHFYNTAAEVDEFIKALP